MEDGVVLTDLSEIKEFVHEKLESVGFKLQHKSIGSLAYYGSIEGIEYGLYFSPNGVVSFLPEPKHRSYPTIRLTVKDFDFLNQLINYLFLSVQERSALC